MIRVIRCGAIEVVTEPTSREGWTAPADAAWIDMHEPTVAEEKAVEAFVGVPLPTRDDMVEIEASSRLYREDGAVFMTAVVLSGADTETPTLDPITFVLVGERLVTIRYADPKPIRWFGKEAERHPAYCESGAAIFLGLLEAIVDRLADVLEHTSAEVEGVGRAVFAQPRPTDFSPLLTRLARAQNLDAKARESLVSLGRLLSYAQLAPQIERVAGGGEQLKSLDRDVRSLTDHASFLAGNIAFLLDGTLGLISVEQNQIIKIFSVAAVAFLPPTLIASIYGMNFEHMPELPQPWGYPMALGLMVVSAILPLLWFKRKGWL